MAGASKGGMERYKPIIDFTKRIAAQAELNNLSKMIRLDSIGEEELPNDSNFPDYIRSRMDTQGKRDPSKDMWLTMYRIRRKGSVIIISSAGPDKRFDTKDDVASRIQL